MYPPSNSAANNRLKRHIYTSTGNNASYLIVCITYPFESLYNKNFIFRIVSPPLSTLYKLFESEPPEKYIFYILSFKF